MIFKVVAADNKMLILENQFFIFPWHLSMCGISLHAE